MTLNCLAMSSSIPPSACGHALLPYGVIVHNTGWTPPSDAGRNQPSSRTPSDIFTAISWHADVAAFDGSATSPNPRTSATTVAQVNLDLRISDIDTPRPTVSP